MICNREINAGTTEKEKKKAAKAICQIIDYRNRYDSKRAEDGNKHAANKPAVITIRLIASWHHSQPGGRNRKCRRTGHGSAPAPAVEPLWRM